MNTNEERLEKEKLEGMLRAEFCKIGRPIRDAIERMNWPHLAQDELWLGAENDNSKFSGAEPVGHRIAIYVDYFRRLGVPVETAAAMINDLFWAALDLFERYEMVTRSGAAAAKGGFPVPPVCWEKEAVLGLMGWDPIKIGKRII